MKHLDILLIEDNDEIAAAVGDRLEDRGMTVDYASGARQGLHLALEHAFDVIILDLMLPDGDGIDVCRAIKAERDVPILMLTARDSLQDKVAGFGVGADDYLTKPFALEELALRCQALARRKILHQSRETVIGSLKVNHHQRTAYRAGSELTLSVTDFDILLALVDAYPKAVSRQKLMARIWGQDLPGSDVLRSHIYTLRQVLDKPFDHKMIKTIHGVGFRLEGDDGE